MITYLDLNRRVKSLFDNSDVSRADEMFTALVRAENLIENHRPEISTAELKALKAMLKQPQPKGFKVFLKALIQSITEADLATSDAKQAVWQAQDLFFSLTRTYRRAFSDYKECINANL